MKQAFETTVGLKWVFDEKEHAIGIAEEKFYAA
jgi:hypothetical protein